ncbi:MAG: hypothetical protein KC561_19100, partial [Myxococcales bacterium]|nr:hypothetical protein [Myxococcales bacterium]
LMVRDLARRLPAMVLPRWLKNHSWPVAIDDVVAAILAGLQLEGASSQTFEVPGPERLSHKDVLFRASRLIRGKAPLSIAVPVLSPRLSSYWIALVTSADLSMARELVQGITADLDPAESVIWERLPDIERTPLETAIRNALADETTGTLPSETAVKRMSALGNRFMTDGI